MTHFPINTPLGIGDLLDRVFRLYRIHASKMILGVALFAVPLGILSALLTQDATANSLRMLRQMIETGQPVIQQASTSPWAVLITPLAFLVQGMIALVTTKLTIDALHNRPLNVAEAIRTALRKIFPWLGMTILIGLAMLAVGIAVLIIFVIVAFVFGVLFAVLANGFSPLASSEPGIALMLGIGVIAFVLYIAAIVFFLSPFVYFYARWSVCLPALLSEGQGVTTAMGRSWNLTQQNTRRAVGYVVLANLLVYAVVGAPTNLLQLLAGFALPVESQWLSVGLISALGVITNVLLSPISGIAMVLFYYELRVRKESYDLQVQLASNQGFPER